MGKRAYCSGRSSTILTLEVITVFFRADRETADSNTICCDFIAYRGLTVNLEQASGVAYDTVFYLDSLCTQAINFVKTQKEHLVG